MFEKNHWWTQLSKNGTVKDLKNRCYDHLKAAGIDIEIDDLRLWLHTTDYLKGQDYLKSVCEEVKQGFIDIEKQHEIAPENPDENEEINSGIKFPGDSIDPLIRNSIRLYELNIDLK